MDPPLWYDADLSVWPHLAESYDHINDTHVRITIREGVKWTSDQEGNYTDEYLDVKDVFFTFYCWKYISNDQHLFDWLEDMTIIDNYTLDLYIDGNSTTPGNEPLASYFPYLSTNILPEHYLNQTQLADEVTPDITHGAWEKFSNYVFGTGLFEITDFNEGIDTILAVKPDCWRLNQTITSDVNLNWENRFGDFSGGLDQLRIRIIPDLQTSLLEFEAGKIDLEGISWNPEKKEQFILDPRIDLQRDTTFHFAFVGYNMRENREHIGSREPCLSNSSITKGLAIRKAISYAIDLEEINNVIHGGEYLIHYTPLYPKMGIWNNPDIIRYDYDFEMAKYYMYIAGYDLEYTPTTDFISYTGMISIFSIYSMVLFIAYKKRKK
jgi:ABC-type transport system substrate-binding protein